MSKNFLNETENSDINLELLDKEEFEFERIIGGDYNVMSLSDEKKAKDMLSTMRKNVGFRLDGKKLILAEQAITTIEEALAITNDRSVLDVVKANIKTAEDLSHLTKVMSESVKVLQYLMRLDSIDGQGTAGKINVGVQFTGSNGNTTSVIVQANGN